MKDSPSYQDFVDYLRKYVGSQSGSYILYEEFDASTRSYDTLTVLPPIEANEAALIKMLWGTAALNNVIDNKLKTAGGLKNYLHNVILPTWEVNIQKMEMPGGSDHSSIIIPATAIQKQHVDTTNKVITIPIKAFEGKSLIKLRSIPDVEGEPMIEYHFILLQSAKDPHWAQPVKLWKGERTQSLKSMLTQNNVSEWDIQIESGDSLLALMEGQYKGNTTKVSIRVPKSLYNTATHKAVRRTPGLELLSLGVDPTQLALDPATHSILLGDSTGSTPYL